MAALPYTPSPCPSPARGEGTLKRRTGKRLNLTPMPFVVALRLGRHGACLYGTIRRCAGEDQARTWNKRRETLEAAVRVSAAQRGEPKAKS